MPERLDWVGWKARGEKKDEPSEEEISMWHDSFICVTWLIHM